MCKTSAKGITHNNSFVGRRAEELAPKYFYHYHFIYIVINDYCDFGYDCYTIIMTISIVTVTHIVVPEANGTLELGPPGPLDLELLQ